MKHRREKNTVDTVFFTLGALCRETAQSSEDPSEKSPSRISLQVPLWRAAWAERGEKLPVSEAYFTVEAALVMPVVLCILVMIMYLSFYLYDRCVLSQDLYLISYRQSIEKGGADRAGAARGQMADKLFMVSGLDTDVSEGGTIRAKGNARMEPPVFGLPFFDGNRRWSLGVAEKAKKTDPPKDYRRVRRLMYIASKALPGQGE